MSDDEGWTGGYDVFVPEGRVTCVLGPDGEPVRYLSRHKLGFDLRPKHIRESGQPSRTHTGRADT